PASPASPGPSDRLRLRGPSLPEPAPPHVAPAATVRQELPEGLHLAQREDLPVAEVFYDAEDDQLAQIQPPGVAPERKLFEQDCGDGEEDPVEDRQREEKEEELPVDDAEDRREGHDEIAQDLDERTEGLEEEEVGEGDRAHD